MTVKELQEHARELAGTFQGATLERRVMFLVTEVGEMAREALKLSGAYGAHPDVDREKAKENLGMEMYDAMWNICDLANLAGIDLESAIAKKIEVNRNRQWRQA